MADVNDYSTGKILRNVKLAFFLLKFAKTPIISPLIKKGLLRKTKKFEPRKIDIITASKSIQRSNKCAVGERVCRAIHKKSEFTEAIFIDELAEGMVNARKAQYVTKEKAVDILNKYKNPLILSKVSGKYMEICTSSPKNCIYWNMEKCGLECLNR